MTAGQQPAIVELRRYVLHPGARDTLIELFDRELVETQEATGMTLLAQFRDLDHPDVLTWLRGFPSMPARTASLAAFYDGPVWARHRRWTDEVQPELARSLTAPLETWRLTPTARSRVPR